MSDDPKYSAFRQAVLVAAGVIALLLIALTFYTYDTADKKPVEVTQVDPQPTPPPLPTNPQGFKCIATVEEFKRVVIERVPIATFWEPSAALSAEVMKFYNSIPPASNVPGGKRIIIIPPNAGQPRPYLAIVDDVGGKECVIINGFFGVPIWKEIERRWPNA